MNDAKEGNRIIVDTGFTERLGSSDTAAAIMAGKQCGTAQLQDISGYPYMLVPDGMELVQCENLLPAPLRIKTTRNFEEPDSFCTYISQFSDNKTRLYGISDDLKMCAVFDDHQPGTPAWAEHQAILALKYSPEWAAWVAACGQKIGQQDLADFFEAHIDQIAQPDAGDLLSDIRNIHISTNTKCDSVLREGGDIVFTYSTETTAGTKTARGKVPSRLVLVLAPFRSWNPIQVVVTLTYSLSKERELFFAMRMLQVEALVGSSFNDVRNYVQDKVGLPILL